MERVNRRGWIVTLKDGTEMSEWDYEWSEVPKADIARLTLVFEGRVWHISDKPAYIQRKRGSISTNSPDFTIEKRIIGYYEDEFKVEYIVDERTGIMHMHVTEV